jgi:hypothetical protein
MQTKNDTHNHEKTMQTKNDTPKPEDSPQKVTGEGCQERLVRPDILLDRCRYEWDQTEGAYFGNEGSCGTYGAALDNGKWIPAWMPTDSADAQWADESFDDPQSAIARSHSYFS